MLRLATITEDICGVGGCDSSETILGLALIAAFCFCMWLFFHY